jgi:bifunctional DNA-binding transcriptional regulator/antitoxin component of YhaV-PrlF toxin-antitoxin module
LQEEIIKILPKGIMTIPIKFRTELGFTEPGLARVKKEGKRLIIEPVYTVPYPIRTYSDKEIDEFLAEDAKETKTLRKKGLLP